MLIDNPDALKAWLTSTLAELCDADPQALAKYVFALIKKDKPVEELRQSMEDQMEVFLQENNKDFVSLLFATLENKSYLQPISPPSKIKQEKVEEVEAKPDGKANSGDPVEGKPDSTTVVPKTTDEKKSPPNEPPYKPTKRVFEEEPRANRARRSPPVRRRESRRSPIPRRYRSRSPVYRRGVSPPIFPRRRRSPYRRSRSRSYSPPPPRKFISRGSTPTKDEDIAGYTPSTREDKKVRCRDYDEKGFCMKGDQCKFDHGTDALVLEDASATGIAFPPAAAVVPAATIFPEPYVPAVVPLPPLHIPPPGYPPESVHSTARKRQFHEISTDFTSFSSNQRFDYNRIGRGRGMLRGRGGRGRGGLHPTQSTHLAVRNIPSGMNTIAHLNNHFAKFGALTNVQVHFEGDPGSALVTFASPAEADLAVNSTDAVMGNRFIKVFFHQENKNVNTIPVKTRVGDKVTADGDNLTKTIVNEEVIQKAALANQSMKDQQKVADIIAIKKNQEVLEVKAKMQRATEEKTIQTKEKIVALRNAKQELLDNLIEEQKKLLLKVDEKKKKPEERSVMISLIKSINVSIEKAKEDLKKLVHVTAKKRTVSDVQKDLLDAELELFTAQQNGQDTPDYQKRVNQLKVEAARMGVLPTSRSPRMRGSSMPFYSPRASPRFPRVRGGRGRGRYQGPGVTSVDRRPAKILVSGYELDDKDSLVEHFTKFGEILDTLEDEITPSIIIHYKTRRFAEAAMAGGKTYGDRLLQLSWYTGSTPSDYHSELVPEDSTIQTEEIEDDYTPLDPAYLPPGLEEEENGDKPDSSVTSKGANESNDEFANEDLGGELLVEDEDEEDGEERPWKH